MSSTIKSLEIAQACALTVAYAVSNTQMFTCSRHSINHSTALLIEQLRRFYAENIKTLLKQHNCDSEMQRVVGTSYGALVTHMQATSARYWVFKNAGYNPCINMSVVERECYEAAARDGISFATLSPKSCQSWLRYRWKLGLGP